MLDDTFNIIALWWDALDMPVRTALISAGATLTAATTAASVVAWQVRAQARNSVLQSEKNEATKLKLQIYERILKICAEASRAESEYSSFLRLFPMNLRRLQFCQANNLTWSVPNERYATFAALRLEAETRGIDVITAVENWGIIDVRMSVFQIAISAALHDVREAGNRYFAHAMRLYPAPTLADPKMLFRWSVPLDSEIAELEMLTAKLIDAVDDVGCYVHDFRVEMQRCLLGDLFSRGKISVRMPLDPKKVVITLEAHKKLTRYFETETAWGINAERIKAEVRASFVEAAGQRKRG